MSAKHDVEWPSEKKKPTPSGRFSSCRNLRVVLSIAAMWSASNAWRRPNVYASVPSPASAGFERAKKRKRPQPSDVEERDGAAEAGEAEPLGAGEGGNRAEHRATSLSGARGRSSRRPRRR